MHMKSILMVGLLMMAVLVGCDKQNSKQNPTALPIIKVGTTGQSYPNGFKQHGELVGFDVEITQAIAKELGYQIDWVIAEFGGLMAQLDVQRLDTVANAVAVTAARQEKYDFSLPYSYYGSQIVINSHNQTIHSLADLKGKTISGVLGSNHINALKKVFPNGDITIRTYETRDGAMYDLVYNRVDAYINAKPILLAEIKQNHVPFKLLDEPLMMESVAYPFNRNTDGDKLKMAFNEAIAKLKQQGTLKAISEKYYGQDITIQ